MRWWFKATIQKGISILPGGRTLHHFLQRKVWRSLKISEPFLIDRLSHVTKHLNAWEKHHANNLPDKALELGTGWYPIVPVGLFLSGLDQVYTVDQNRYFNMPCFAELMTWLQDWHEDGLLKKHLPSLKHTRWEQLLRTYQQHQSNFTALLEALNIQYWVGDARTLPYPDDHFSLIHSNNTFEHIPPKTLSALLAEMNRVLKVKGCMSHYIDMADHYSYGDPNLSPFHYLRFTERQWHWIENRFQSQNRLRINQYEDIYAELGLENQRLEVELGTPSQLAAVKLASPFKDFPAENLSVLYAQLVSYKK
ncbi:MAG: class I SAM-dependent methyltransferase [Bacteroidia bacterium]